MLSKIVKISIVLLCLFALAVPSPAKSAADESPLALSRPSPPTVASVYTEVNPTTIHIGGIALVSVKMNKVPAEGYKSAEFICTYNAVLVEKSNIIVTDLFGDDPVTAIHDLQNGRFIVAVAGANSNRAMTSGTAFTFSVKGLQAGQSAVRCAARVSGGENLAIDIPSSEASLTILAADVSPTPFVPPTMTPPLESPAPTPLPNGLLSGQILASKPVTVHLLDANNVEMTSMSANQDGTFLMTPTPGDYILVATASGFLSFQGSLTVTAGEQMVVPTVSLLAGDVDGNNVIDQFDALTIGMNYTASTPEAADLNNDGVIDFLDLELLAGNYRQTGPTTGEPSNPGPAETLTPTAIGSPLPDPKPTVVTPNATQPTESNVPDVPPCPTHDPMKWHGLWDRERGCHYDHEHGISPFTPEVAAMFPGFDLQAMLCGTQIGHCVPSGPTEHSHKHGGFKWNVQLKHPEGCAGFEGAAIGVDGSVIQLHGFGNYAVELEASVHSVVALLRQCSSDLNDHGYVFMSQHVSYGEVVSPYQGDLLMYPYYSVPVYDPAFGPYLTVGCIGEKLPGQRGDCRDNLAQARVNNADSTWTSKPTGSGVRPANSSLIQVLWRLRDTYQLFDWSDQTYPYTFLWLCSSDGLTYNPVGCRYNNSTTQVHEVQGTIPAAWDNLAGFDTDTRVGRITAQGFVTNIGDLNTSCTTVGPDCQPIKLVQAFVGKYGSVLVFTPGKGTNIVPYLPERDIYFCAGVPCSETSPGAVPSGWIGDEN